ncbi:TrlF family AAA-like ATPase [Desulfosporosinus sp. I2]|uniref:TrlF family AAA-like ATPase n=1 Tax=Desulfosporosinus sp. I2 TaxID=1617025 RepID=UPI0032B7AECF
MRKIIVISLFLIIQGLKKRKKASHFEAKLVWESGDESSIKNLMDVPEEHSYERVKYIPQNFFETICNDNPDDFETELKKVIFSHVDASEKLGQKSLEELIDYKSQVLLKDITLFQNEGGILNKDIIDLEKKRTATYRKSIEEGLSNKKLELANHQSNKPKDVAKLESNGDYQKSIDEEIKYKRAEKEKLEEELNLATKKKSEQKIKQSNLERISQAIDTFQSQYEKLKTDNEPFLKTIGFKFEDAVQVHIDKNAINTLVETVKIKIETLSDSIKPDNENGLAFKIIKLGEEITNLQSKLDEPTKRYQTYLDDISKWEQREQELIGAEDIELTLKYYEGVLIYLDNELENDLAYKREQRKGVVSQLHEKKRAILEVYKELYKPVTGFLEQYKNINKDYEITFDVSFRLKDFEEKFLNYVNQGVKGTFYGNKEGTVTLKQIILETDFNTLEGVIEFFDKIIICLERDRRPGQGNESREIQSQIKNGFYLDMYNLIFNLDYLVPYYELKLGGKSILQLSPGEKGALLLIFYLILDQDDIPLIIDQPEENLDNQSVYNILVPFIKHAKSNRQIIIVTHNPNIAVVCDAEQIIHVSISKTQDNEMSINSGAIENPSINSSIVQILEGTMPAFEKRELKYTLTKNNMHSIPV